MPAPCTCGRVCFTFSKFKCGWPPQGGSPLLRCRCLGNSGIELSPQHEQRRNEIHCFDAMQYWYSWPVIAASMFWRTHAETLNMN